MCVVTQLCPILCDPVYCSPPGTSVHGILQARILEWVAISFFRGSSWPKDRTWVSRTTGRCFTLWATREAQESEVTQSCLTLCDPMDCSLAGFSVHGTFQARILEWVAISFSRGSSRPRDRTWVSRILGSRFTLWATREANFSSYLIEFIKLKTPFPLWDIRKAPNTNEFTFTASYYILHIILHFLMSSEAHWVDKLDRFNRKNLKPSSAGDCNDHLPPFRYVGTIHALLQWPRKLIQYICSLAYDN